MKINKNRHPASMKYMSQATEKLPSDWDRQRAFLALMREGSLSAASRHLNIAQPTARRRIEDLEQEHGVVLFTRSPSGLTPTGIAYELAANVESMARAADAFTRAASAEAESTVGTTHISSSKVVGVEVLPPMLARLRANHSGLEIELSLSNRSENLLSREADIAVRMTEPKQDALVAKHIGAIHLGLYANRNYVENFGAPTTFADLKDLAMIGFETETIGIHTFRRMGLSFQRKEFAYRSNSDLAQLAAIRAGIGVCQTCIGEHDPDLISLLPDAFDLALQTWIVTHEDLRHVRRIRLAYDALVEEMAAYARS